jgi:Protein of unknown function (DUF3617)
MKVRLSSVLLLTLCLAWSALAQTPSPMREGNWETSLTIPGMEGAPMKQTQCITAAMLKDPTAAIPKGPGGADCKMTDYKITGNTATYKMSCTQPMQMNMVGEMKYTGTDAYTGTMTIDMGSGQTMAFGIDAKRVGDCAK